MKVAVTESVAPDGVRARTHTAPRAAGARNIPKKLMGAAVGSLVLHDTKNCVTGTPPLKACAPSRNESFRRMKGLRGRITTLSAAGPM